MAYGQIRKIAVIGSGTMGHGIAELSAMAGFETTMIDVNEELLKSAMSRISASLEKLRSKGNISDTSAVLSRLKTSIDLESSVASSDFIIEAVPESIELKRNVFMRLDRSAPRDAILATNTSSLPITEIATVTERKERIVGMHFFNPPVIMKLVEIIRGKYTDDQSVKEAYELARKFGKQPVVVKSDVPGFIVNRIIARLYNTACWIVSSHLASPEEVDATSRYILNFPMGPFELADFSGIDTIYYMLVAMKEHGFEINLCDMFERKYRSGELGVKSGIGFYSYAGGKPKMPADVAGRVDPLYIIAPIVNEASWLISHGIASRDDVNKAVMLGLNYQKGPFEYAKQFGVDKVIQILEELRRKTGWADYDPDPGIAEYVR